MLLYQTIIICQVKFDLKIDMYTVIILYELKFLPRWTVLKLIKKTFLLILSLIMIFSVCSSVISVNAAEDVKVKLIASALKAEPGDRFSVTYSFENAADYKYGLTAFTSKLKFDSNQLRCVNVTHSKFNNSALTTNRALTGEVRTLYTYASLTKDPGVNTNEAFVTYTFVVTKTAVAGKASLSLDFDTIVTTDYDESPAKNKTLTYNKPTISVEIISDNVAATSSEAAVTSQETTASGSSSTDEVVSSNKKPSDKAPDKITTVDESYLNPEFSASDIAAGETVEKEPTQSELIAEAESKISEEFSNAGIDPNDVYKKGFDISLPLFIGLIAVGVVALAAIITLIIIIATKKKN